MNVFEIVTIAIAIFSFSVSIFVVLRDRKSRRLDLLYRCYERVTNEFNKRPSVSLDTRAKMDENPDDPFHVSIRTQEKDIFYNLEKELNTTCFFLLKRQLNAKHFYNLFGVLLKSRFWMWSSTQKHNIHNFKFTWEAIQYYNKKGYFQQKT